MGTWVVGQIQATSKGTPLGVAGAEHHPPHARLHQGTGAHGAGLQGYQQGAIVEAPVLA
jgi:hypothetical protein